MECANCCLKAGRHKCECWRLKDQKSELLIDISEREKSLREKQAQLESWRYLANRNAEVLQEAYDYIQQRLPKTNGEPIRRPFSDTGMTTEQYLRMEAAKCWLCLGHGELNHRHSTECWTPTTAGRECPVCLGTGRASGTIHAGTLWRPDGMYVVHEEIVIGENESRAGAFSRAVQDGKITKENRLI